MYLIEAGIELVKEFKDFLSHHFIIVALFIAAGCMLLLRLPKDVIDIFYIDGFRKANSEIIGGVAYAALIVAGGGVLFKLAASGVNLWRNRRDLEKEKRDEEKAIRNLSVDELSYLIQFFLQRSTVVEFDKTDPVVNSLVKKDLIYPYLSARVALMSIPRYKSSYHNGQPFEIPFWVYQYLKEHPDYFRQGLSEDDNASTST